MQSKIECGHVFCKECLEKWAKKEKTCPKCRITYTKVSNQKVNKRMIKMFNKQKEERDEILRRSKELEEEKKLI